MTDAAHLRLVMAQIDLLVGDVAGNAERIVAACEQARDALGAHLIVFPELTLTGYPPEDLLLRPGMASRVARGIDALRGRVSGIDVLFGYPEQLGRRRYNAASLLRGGELVATYRKHELPNYRVFDEKRYFTPGTEPAVVRVHGVDVGITVCEDLWVPGVVEQSADAGAQVVVNLNASPYRAGKGAEREAVVAERVRDAGVPVVYVNLLGGQDELVFDGGSFAMDARGRVAVRAPLFEAGLYPVDLHLADGAVVPVPGERAPLPNAEEAVYAALVLGLRDYVDKNGFPGVVVGLSGGVDSALTLALAVDALGPERVEAVMMPSRYTAAMSLEDAQAEAKALGVSYRVLPIERAFAAFTATLAEAFAGLPADSTEENIQARCRGVLLMALSNKTGRLVVTTGNKSEMAVGYATLYGDMAGGFAALKDVPKTLVYRLARHRNTQGAVIPERVLTRPPSAELAPDQRDEDSLPPYPVLDAILEMYIEQDRPPAHIVAAGYDPQTVRRVVTLVDRNEYKRRQAPPGVRVTRRAFGRDRRYPITSGYNRAEDWAEG
jgi:NAD+ synthase (glutamine-hydrolysing)